MPHETEFLGTPDEWMEYARSDLALAGEPHGPRVRLETVCFHAQQAVEKAVKAVLVQAGVTFPKVHSIERLLDLLPAAIERTPDLLKSRTLSAYATVPRYPSALEPVSEQRAREVLRVAEAVVAWAEDVLRLSK